MKELSKDKLYSLPVLRVGEFEGKPVYLVSFDGYTHLVKKYPRQSDDKQSVKCVFQGLNVFGKPLFVQKYPEVLKEIFQVGESYPFYIEDVGFDQLKHEYCYVLVDDCGFKHRIERSPSFQYLEGDTVLAKVLNNDGGLSLQIIQRVEPEKPVPVSTELDFSAIDADRDTTLRDYQVINKKKIYQEWNQHRSVMLQMPTGTGKTRLFVSIVRDIFDYGREHHRDYKVLILAHRKELIEQISTHLGKKYGLPHGLIMAQNIEQKQYSMQVGSVPTLTRRLDRWESNKFDVIIVDEAHHVKAKSYRDILDRYPEAKILGVTATPYRLSGAGFRPEFDTLIISPPVSEFIKKGHLCEYDYYSIKPTSKLQAEIDRMKLDFEGDYQEREMMGVMDRDFIRANILKTYKQFAQGKKGIVYTVNQIHSAHLHYLFTKAGIKSAVIDSHTPAGRRDALVSQFKNGVIQVLFNVNIFSEGFDCPDVEFIQLARPTTSLSLYLQQVGRGFRPAKGKEKVLILDNVGLYNKFGFPSARRKWQYHFEGRKNIDESPLAHLSDPESGREVHEIYEGNEEVSVIHSSLMEEYNYSDDYRSYLSSQGFSKRGADNSIKSIKADIDSAIHDFVSRSHKSVFLTVDVELLDSFRRRLEKNVEFMDYCAKKHNYPLSCFGWYINFAKVFSTQPSPVHESNPIDIIKPIDIPVVEERKDASQKPLDIAENDSLSELREIIKFLKENGLPVPQDYLDKYKMMSLELYSEFRDKKLIEPILGKLKELDLQSELDFIYELPAGTFTVLTPDLSDKPDRAEQNIDRIVDLIKKHSLAVTDEVNVLKQRLEKRKGLRARTNQFESWLRNHVSGLHNKDYQIEAILYTLTNGIRVSIKVNDPMGADMLKSNMPDEIVEEVLHAPIAAEQQTNQGVTVVFEGNMAAGYSQAWRAFYHTIEEIGVERVKALNMVVGGKPLILNKKHPNVAVGSRQLSSGDYLYTAITKQQMQETIKTIADRLSLKIQFEFV